MKAGLDTGEAHLPAVVCLHSLFLSPRMFDELVERGAGQFRFIRPEFPGQGSRVDEPSAVVTMDECADDLIRTIEALGLTSVAIVGQSMGGDVAVRVAARRPDLVRALVFSGSSVRAEKRTINWSTRAASVITKRRGFGGPAVNNILGFMFGETTRTAPERRHIIDQWGPFIRRLSPNLVWAVRGVTERKSAVHLLPLIKAPTLVINGLEDPVRPDAWATEVTDGITGATQLRIPDAGHSTILERPDIVIPAILEFLSAH